MRRTISIGVVCIIVIAAFLLVPRSGEGGCHGTCFGPPPTPPPAGSTATPTPEQAATPTNQERCEAGFDTQLLGLAELDPQTQRPLCLIDFVLSSGTASSSQVDPGEATAFYVREGAIDFSVDAGSVRVVPGPNDEQPALQQLPDGSHLAKSGDKFTLSAGGSVYLDLQNEQVMLNYANNSEGEAALLIASAPPAAGSEIAPTP